MSVCICHLGDCRCLEPSSLGTQSLQRISHQDFPSDLHEVELPQNLIGSLPTPYSEVSIDETDPDINPVLCLSLWV